MYVTAIHSYCISRCVARAPVRSSETLERTFDLIDSRTMSNPHFPRYEMRLKEQKCKGSSGSGTKARQFPGGSGAPPGYSGSWLTGFTRSPITVVAPPATAAPPPVHVHGLDDRGFGGTTSASSSNGNDAATPTVTPHTPTPQRHRPSLRMHYESPPRRSSRVADQFSRTPPIWLWRSPSTPVTPERTWGKRTGPSGMPITGSDGPTPIVQKDMPITDTLQPEPESRCTKRMSTVGEKKVAKKLKIV